MLVFMLVRGQFLVELKKLSLSKNIWTYKWYIYKEVLEKGLLSLNEKGPENCREGNNLTC